MEYVKQLLIRLLKVIEENEKEKVKYEKLLKHLDNLRGDYDTKIKNLNEQELKVLYNRGVIYSKSAMKRLRIEINKSMIELEK